MQLSINKPSLWVSPTSFKPFLLVGIAAVSSVALCTPLSSQAKDLKTNIISNAIKPLSPFTKTATDGASKLFGTLGSWTKTAANTSETVNKWISEATSGNVPDGAKAIYSTLNDWGWKVYEFLKSLFDEDAWKRFKENMRHLSKFLNIFKNIMKAELGGKASIFREILGAAGKEGFSEAASALGDLAAKNPDVFADMNEKETEEFVAAINEDPKAMAEVMDKLAKKDEPVTKDQLLNASEPNMLMAKIRTTLDKAKKFEEKEKLEGEELGEAQKVFSDLKELLPKLENLIQKAKQQQEKSKKA